MYPPNLGIHGRDPVHVWPGPDLPGFPIFGSKSGAASDWAPDNTLSDIITISSRDNIGREIKDYIAIQADNLSSGLHIVFVHKQRLFLAAVWCV